MAGERCSLRLVLSENPQVWPEGALLGGCHSPLPILPPLLSTLPVAPAPAATTLTTSQQPLPSLLRGLGWGWPPAVGSPGVLHWSLNPAHTSAQGSFSEASTSGHCQACHLFPAGRLADPAELGLQQPSWREAGLAASPARCAAALPCCSFERH